MRLKTLIALAFIATLSAMLSGCASDSPKQLYYWDGAYTSSVYEYLTEEGDAGAQIAALEESLQKAYQKAAKVPPGLHAHLGLLYLSQGNGAKFRQNVEKEAQLYPESRDYALFLLNQNGKAGKFTGEAGKASGVNSGGENTTAPAASETSGDKTVNLNGAQAKDANAAKSESSQKSGEFNAGDKTSANLAQKVKTTERKKPSKFSASEVNPAKNGKTNAQISETAKGSQNEK